mmetsp:Transcript_41302/g.89479  ORF Transcript_41302/g.89479 Transcript_41302/m.89479 type:complete len:194 (+) Transcript_41302:156-737(+)
MSWGRWFAEMCQMVGLTSKWPERLHPWDVHLDHLSIMTPWSHKFTKETHRQGSPCHCEENGCSRGDYGNCHLIHRVFMVVMGVTLVDMRLMLTDDSSIRSFHEFIIEIRGFRKPSKLHGSSIYPPPYPSSGVYPMRWGLKETSKFRVLAEVVKMNDPWLLWGRVGMSRGFPAKKVTPAAPAHWHGLAVVLTEC